MAITNPFTITWGSLAIGGSSSTYLLHNPYVIDKSFGALRLTFDVVIVADSHASLKTYADALEAEFRKRSQNLIINLNGSSWTYTAGTDLLNGTAQAVKSGDPATDKGVSRKYTCTITGELPADDAGGLRDLAVQVKYEPGRQKIVSMSGTYTSLAGVGASAVYLANFDATASSLLSAIDGSADFELVSEDYTRDRLNATCQFARQYIALLSAQSEGNTDSTRVRSHRVTFTNLSAHPGDSEENVYRLRRVQAVYEGFADVDVNDDLHTLADDVCEPYVRREFRQEFTPKVYALEDRRVMFDETSKRISLALTFVYQPDGGSEVVEVSKSVGFREERQIDYTYVHDGEELSAYADPGFLVLERITQRVAIVIGDESPSRRLAEDEDAKIAGKLDIDAPQTVQQSGWNRISNTSTVTPQWIGEPGGDTPTIRVTVLNESVVERYNVAPSGTSGGGGPVTTPGGGTTPGKSR